MYSIFSPPPGYSPWKLGAFALLSFVLAGVALFPALNRDAGILNISAMTQAHGRVVSVSPEKYGVKFRLDGRAETFSYPSKARAYGVVQSALTAAGNKEVAVLFDPKPNIPWSNSDSYYDVWQLAIDGKNVRTVTESAEAWRSDNAVAPWICGSFFLSGIYLSFLTRRALLVQRL